MTCGAWWLIGRFVIFRPLGHGLESHSSCHVGTLGKSLTCSCLWRFGVKLRRSIHAVSGAPLSNSGLGEALYNIGVNSGRLGSRPPDFGMGSWGGSQVGRRWVAEGRGRVVKYYYILSCTGIMFES